MQTRNKTSITKFLIFNMYLLYIGKFIIAKTEISGPPIVNYYLMLVTLFLTLPFWSKYSKYIVGYGVAVVGYCTFKALVYNMPYIGTLQQYSSFFFLMLMCIYLYENLKVGKLDVSKIKKHFYIIFAMEVLLAAAQFLYQPVYDFFKITWSWRGQIIGGVDDTVFWYKEPAHVIGTFFSRVAYAGFISVFTIIGFVDCLFHPKGRFRLRMVIVIAGIVSVFMTGIRAPFMVTSVMMLFAIRRFKRKWFVPALTAAIVSVIVFMGYTVADEDSSIYRIQMGVIAMFSGNMDLVYGQTIGYSLYMIPYFLREPIFGISLGEAYRVGRYTLSEFSSTDVQLMYILCEVGIVGFLMLLWPTNNMGKILKDRQYADNVRIILLTCYALTIVDDIFFTWEARYIFALSMCFFGGHQILTNRNLQHNEDISKRV